MRLASLLLVVLLVACVSRGRGFDPDSIPRIEEGSTTQAEIRRWFGDPVAIRVRSSGITAWRYYHEEQTRRDTGTLTKIGRSIASIFGGRVYAPPLDVAYENTTRHELWVIFDPDGIVVDHVYERHDTPTRRVY